MIVRRNVTTIGKLGVVIEPHVTKKLHNVSKVDTFKGKRYRLPTDIGRTVKTEHRNHTFTVSLTDSGSDILHQLNHKALAVLEEPLGLADTGLLCGGETTTTRRIETGRRTPIGGHRTGVITRKSRGGKVHDESHIPKSLALDSLGVTDSEQLHTLVMSYFEGYLKYTLFNRVCQGGRKAMIFNALRPPPYGILPHFSLFLPHFDPIRTTP